MSNWGAGTATLILLDSTIGGNSTSIGNGGGIDNYNTLTVLNSTVNGNTAGQRGGGILNSSGGTITLNTTIIAGNTAVSGGPDCSGIPASQGHNLIGDSSGCSFTAATGDLLNVDPLLGPLQDNGGPTFTHALLPGSPAIDAGDDATCLDTDQRGISRPQRAACDIGAYEFVEGDANGDGVVDAADLRFVATALGASGPGADLNGDGLVDSYDLALVGINLGRGGPVITVPPPDNQPPVADAGPDETVDVGDTVTLDGTGSSDPDGEVLTFSWAQTAGAAVTLLKENTATPSFRATDNGDLTFELTVTDPGGLTDTDTVDVTVNVAHKY